MVAWALSTALTIYPCQIRVHQRWQSRLQLPAARKKEWRPATAGSSPHGLPVNTVILIPVILIHTTLVGLEPATFRSLVDCWSDALPVVPPILTVYVYTQRMIFSTNRSRFWQLKIASTGWILKVGNIYHGYCYILCSDIIFALTRL